MSRNRKTTIRSLSSGHARAAATIPTLAQVLAPPSGRRARPDRLLRCMVVPRLLLLLERGWLCVVCAFFVLMGVRCRLCVCVRCGVGDVCVCVCGGLGGGRKIVLLV